VPVKIGKDEGANVEIASGLTASDAVILNPSDSLVSGQRVEIAKKVDESAPQMEKKEGSQ
jgi:hypothetical protein